MVKTLEEIVLARQVKRQAYEKRYGKDSFHRNDLKPFLNRNNNIKFKVHRIKEDKIILKDITINDKIQQNHLNWFVNTKELSDIKYYRKAFEENKYLSAKVKFSQYVRKNKSKSIGPSSIFDLKMNSKDTNELLLVNNLSFYEIIYKDQLLDNLIKEKKIYIDTNKTFSNKVKNLIKKGKRTFEIYMNLYL